MDVIVFILFYKLKIFFSAIFSGFHIFLPKNFLLSSSISSFVIYFSHKMLAPYKNFEYSLTLHLIYFFIPKNELVWLVSLQQQTFKKNTSTRTV